MREKNYQMTAQKLLEECPAIAQPILELRYTRATSKRIYFEADVDLVESGCTKTLTLFVRKKYYTAEIVDPDTGAIITDQVFKEFEKAEKAWTKKFGKHN